MPEVEREQKRARAHQQSRRRESSHKPLEAVSALARMRLTGGAADAPCWARTSDPQLVELVLSQLS
jgi:hypothetical protein